MRCVDVTRELAVPTGSIEPSALAAHLENCPNCAASDGALRRFDRLWTQTRPEPTARDWNTVWSNVEARLAAEPVSPPVLVPIRRWARLAPLAAAAAVVVGLALAYRPGPDVAPGLAEVRPAPLIDASVGQTLLYHVDTDDATVVQTNEQGNAEDLLNFYGYDDFLAFLNAAETGFAVEDLASVDRPAVEGGGLPE